MWPLLILGYEHPDTLKVMNGLGNSYDNLGHKQEAMKLREKVFTTRLRILGHEHPDTLLAISNLTSSYRDLGCKQEAMEPREMMSNIRKRMLDHEHPDTVLAMSNVADSYNNPGDSQEIEMKDTSERVSRQECEVSDIFNFSKRHRLAFS